MKNTTKKWGIYICFMVIGGIILICCLMDASTTFSSNTTYLEGLDPSEQNTKDQIQQNCAYEITQMNKLKKYILRSTTIKDIDKDNLNTYVSQIQTSLLKYCQYWSDNIGNINETELQKYMTALQDHKKVLINYVENTNSIITDDKDKINGYLYAKLPDDTPKPTVTPTLIPTAVPTKSKGFMSDPDLKWSKGQTWTPVPEFTPSAMAQFQENMPTLSSGATTGLGTIVDNTQKIMSNVQGNQSNVYRLFGKS